MAISFAAFEAKLSVDLGDPSDYQHYSLQDYSSIVKAFRRNESAWSKVN